MQIQQGQFVLIGVDDQTCNQIDQEVLATAVARMLDLTDVLEGVNDPLKQRRFPQQNLVHELDEALFHVFLGFGDELQAAPIKFCKQLLTDIASVFKELTEQTLSPFRNKFTVVGIGRGELECQEFTPLIEHQMHCEAKFPSGRAFAPSDRVLEHFVGMGTSRVAHLNRGRINKSNARHLSSAGVQKTA